MSLADLLALPVLAQARPEVLHGRDLEGVEVRWVHTSEIFEIGPLLKGGEVLLTTGLGLVGARPEQLRTYVDNLADRGVAGLFLELGRTFTTVPAPLLSAARTRDLVLVALHQVVPFVEVTETVHHALVTDEVAGLRHLEHVNVELTATLLTGGGLPSLLARIADLAGSPCSLVTSDGRVAATTHTGPEAADPGGPACRRAVDVFGVEWGHLVLHTSPGPMVDAVLDRGAVAVALELVRTGGHGPARLGARRALLLDLALDRYRSAAEVAARAEAVGVAPTKDHALVGFCFGFLGRVLPRAAVNAVAEAGRQVLGPTLVAELDGDVLLAGRVGARGEAGLRRVAEQLADTVDRELTAVRGGRLRVVVAGNPAPEAVGLSRSLRSAREACALVTSVGAGPRILLSADVGVHRLLSRLVGDPELEQFVEEQLGALLGHDARRGSDLVATLEAYLACGLNKTRTANVLGVRRQTLYQRIERITTLLGPTALVDHGRRTALDLALLAWRLRTHSTQPTAAMISSLTS